MQIVEQKSTTKNGISLYSTKYNISKIAFGSAMPSVVCSGAALFVRKRTCTHAGAHVYILYHYSANVVVS